MLDTPKHGWSVITIGNWSDRCSYLTDVPFQLLKAMECSCRECKPISVRFDAEGWEYIIVFDWFCTHIISEKSNEDGFDYFSIDINRDELAKELIIDIRKNINKWAIWTDYGNMSEDEISERKKDLLVLCDILEKRLPSNIIYEKE